MTRLSLLSVFSIITFCPHISDGLENICCPLEVGISWTYHRIIQRETSEGDVVQTDTLVVTVVGSRQIDGEQYHVLNDSSPIGQKMRKFGGTIHARTGTSCFVIFGEYLLAQALNPLV